jgi:hypothetical protein
MVMIASFAALGSVFMREGIGCYSGITLPKPAKMKAGDSRK